MLALIGILFSASTFSACSSDSDNSINASDVGVKTEEDLPICRPNLEGEKIYVQEATGYFICDEYGFWDAVSSLPVCNAQTFHTVARERNKASFHYNDVYACDSSSSYKDSLAWRRATEQEIAGGAVCDSSHYGLYAADSSLYYSYMCDLSEDSSKALYEWRYATTAEKFTHKICDKSSELSIFVSYDTSDGSRVAYICESGKWNTASNGEIAAMKVCTDKINGEFVYDTAGRKNSVYVCDSLFWQIASAAEIKSGSLCLESLQGTFVSAKNTDYVCDSLDWRIANAGESLSKSLCTAKEQGEFVKAENNIDEYVCDENKWREATTGEKIMGELCTEAEQGAYKKAGKYAFICDSNNWRNASNYEIAGGGLCTAENYGAIAFGGMSYSGKDSLFYVCDSSNWRDASKEEVGTKSLCTAKLEGQYVIKDSSANGTVYICESGSWRTTNMGEIKTGAICSSANIGEEVNWYHCFVNGWYLMTEETYGVCTLKIDDSVAVQTNPNAAGYGDTVVCDSTAWRNLAALEKSLGQVCTYSKRGEIYDYYSCTDSGWVKDTTPSIGSCYFSMQGSVASEQNPNRKDHGTKYVCDSLRWQLATKYAFNGDIPCTGYTAGTVYNSKVCKLGSWVAASASEISMGKACTSENDGQLYNDSYVCIGGNWQTATEADITYGGRCYVNTDSTYFSSGYMCLHDTWREASAATKMAGVACNKDYYGVLLKDINHVLSDSGVAYAYCGGSYLNNWSVADSLTTLLGEPCYHPASEPRTTYYAEKDGVTYVCSENAVQWFVKK
ncbi:MAG: hypothetical protein WCR04_06285 [Fibrobacteraceae bacterium]